MATKQPVQATPDMDTRIQGYYKSFKVEFSPGEMSLSAVIDFIDSLELAGFKGTTFEKKPSSDDVIGKTGTIEKVEVTKTKNGKEAYIAHVAIEGREEPFPIMFFAKGAARKGDSVKVKKNEAGYITFDILDDDGNPVPF